MKYRAEDFKYKPSERSESNPSKQSPECGFTPQVEGTSIFTFEKNKTNLRRKSCVCFYKTIKLAQVVDVTFKKS